jgi:hypothetical protein
LNEWEKKQIKALGGHNIQITTEFVSPDYNAPTLKALVRSSTTGHTELFRIEPKRSDFPTFSIRWDQADDSVDVDLLNDQEERTKFANRTEGYRGHKTDRVGENPRTQAINIETPRTGPVFKGVVSLNIDLGLSVSDSLHSTE